MKKNLVTNARSLLLPGLLALYLPAIATADNDKKHAVYIKGINVTGANRICGDPVMQLNGIPAPLPLDFGGEFVGEFDPTPGAVDAIPLSWDNCKRNTLLASYTDDNFRSGLGIPEANERILNIPLRNVPINATPNGVRLTLPPQGVLPPNPFPPTKSTPNYDITLGKWLKARGHMLLRCYDDGSAKVRIRFRNLIENGVYSMWALWATTPPGAPGATMVPLPFGGVPNAFVPDKHGRAEFVRHIAYCPLEPTPDESKLLFVSVAYHSDGNLYGATPELPALPVSFQDAEGQIFQSTLPPGVVDHDLMNFPMFAEPL